MRIDEIRVDGFGLLRDLRIRPAPGLTLIRGANEAGKSTLLAFVRAILFGFETRGHPALAGGQRGGWLTVRSGDDRSIRIERYGLTGGGGRLRILDGEGEELGNEMLPRLLQGVEKTVFNNVFAFGLAELAQFGNLTGPEIAARIYGAGMGTGATSVVDIENRLEQRRSALFTKQAQKPRMNILLGEIDGLNDRIAALDLPASFKQAGARRAELEARLATLDGEAGAVSAELRYLERLRDGWPSWLAFKAARARWADLAGSGDDGPVGPADPTDALAGDLLERMSRTEQELERITTRSSDLAEERQRVVAEGDAQPVDAALLAARPEIERLLRAVPEMQADRNRIADREHDRSERNAALAEALRRLGPDWTEDRLVGVDDSLAAQNSIGGPFRVSLETADRDVSTAQAELANADLALSDARAELAAVDPRAIDPTADPAATRIRRYPRPWRSGGSIARRPMARPRGRAGHCHGSRIDRPRAWPGPGDPARRRHRDGPRPGRLAGPGSAERRANCRPGGSRPGRSPARGTPGTRSLDGAAAPGRGGSAGSCRRGP